MKYFAACVSISILALSLGCSDSKPQTPLGPTTVTAAAAPEPEPAPPPPPPEPPPPPAIQYPGSGPEVVTWVAARYPDRLAGGISYEQRVANMEFLRDKIIEVGRCGGMNLSWNLKRGVGPRSIDAIDWRHGEQDINDVVDLASDYDNTSRQLELHWIVVDGPAGWDPYPEAKCE